MKLSIIIPVYNIENYINRCLDSIIKQLPDDCEIIVVNDGSIDNSYLKLIEVKKKYPNIITVLSQKNKGLSAARNYGLNIAKGDYIWFIDGDDYILENTISKLLDYISINHPEILVFNYKKKYNTYIETINLFNDETISVVDFLKRESSLYVWNKIYNRNSINFVRFFEGANNIEDFVFNTQLLPTIKRVNSISLVVNVYDNSNQNSNSRKRTKRHLLKLSNDTYIVHKKLYNEYLQIKNDDIRNCLLSLFNISVAGHIYSLIRFYNLKRVKKSISFYSSINAYPIIKTHNNKANLFIKIANHKFLLIIFYYLYRLRQHFKKL